MSETVGDETQWDYLCPKFIDFNASETTDQLREIDHFFETDHEIKQLVSAEEVVPTSVTPIINVKSKTIDNELQDSNDDTFKYETPPQNKENTEDEDNEIFYSTKKYLSVDRKYKLRSTPMRTLQYNGITPLRETRISSKKKRKNKSKSGKISESSFKMDRLIDAIESVDSDLVNSKPQEIRIMIEEEVEPQTTHEIAVYPSNEDIDENIRIPSEDLNENYETNTADNEVVVNRRESFVIKKAPLKSVTVVSPDKTLKSSKSGGKRFVNFVRRKGTPIKKSVLSSNRKVSSQSIVSRLYSTAKKSEFEFKSMAELLKEFETEPRGCDRSRGVDRKGCGQRSRSSSVSSVTQPKSPKLLSVHRQRPLPRQTEDIIASQIKKYTFKANPIRKKLFEKNYESLLPKVKSTKAPTKAISMNLMTDKRNESRKQTTESKEENEEKLQFKANPMPSFRTPVVLNANKEKKVTAFKPFSFDDRIQILVTKKRSQSEDNINSKDIPRSFFRY